jgi:hypothetical protein
MDAPLNQDMTTIQQEHVPVLLITAVDEHEHQSLDG